MPDLSLAVIVLNYNTWDLAISAINRAVELEGERVSEYILFDDGSTLPSPHLSSLSSRVRLVLGGINRGFSRALNEAARQSTAQILVFFDSDAYPLTSFLSKVLERFESDELLGVLGFDAVRSDGTPSETCFTAPGVWSLLLGQAGYSALQRFSRSKGPLCVITGCMATRRGAHLDIGGFDEDFDFLDVDTDYCIRMSKRGWRVQNEPALVAFHEGGGTPQSTNDRLLKFYQGRWLLLNRHGFMKHPHLCKKVILLRLRAEILLLKMAVKLEIHPTTAMQKLVGRRCLLNFCSRNYC